MKSYWNVLIAGALLASTSIASQGDPSAAERFRAKTGRYMTSAVKESCTKACCRHKGPAGRTEARNAETERTNRLFEAKLGRRLNHEPEAATTMARAAAVTGDCECPQCCD